MSILNSLIYPEIVTNEIFRCNRSRMIVINLKFLLGFINWAQYLTEKVDYFKKGSNINILPSKSTPAEIQHYLNCEFSTVSVSKKVIKRLTLHSIDSAHIAETNTGHASSCVKVADDGGGVEGDGNTSQDTSQTKAQRCGNTHLKLKHL